MNFDKFYDKAYDWVIRFGPRFLVGIMVLFVGLWLIKLLLNRSHKGMHRKEVDPTLKSFLGSLLGVVLRLLLILA
jgi:small conductance mechanosensitive channel